MCLFRRFLAILCLFLAFSVCWADDIITDDNIVSEDIVSGEVDAVPSEAADEVEITVPLRVYPQFVFADHHNASIHGTPRSTFVRELYQGGKLISSVELTIPSDGVFWGGFMAPGINVFSQGDDKQILLVASAGSSLAGAVRVFLDYLFFVNFDLRNNLVPALAVMMTAAIGVVFAWWGLRKMYLAILQSWRNGRITL